ncbi:MAG: hypothetical protein MUE85_02495 [Microscillaceae bacterium]|jgi:hypothetical protein|nr:hypothetical protein [Microscillaceae bacterium]
MKLKDLFNKVGLTNIKVNLQFIEAEFKLSNTADQDAAWEMYVELITRVATQDLHEGDPKTALESLSRLFAITRDILKSKGKDAINFAKIAVVILNQVVRPFTSKWHPLSEELNQPENITKFRAELITVQTAVKKYASLLANMLEIEDISEVKELHP